MDRLLGRLHGTCLCRTVRLPGYPGKRSRYYLRSRHLYPKYRSSPCSYSENFPAGRLVGLLLSVPSGIRAFHHMADRKGYFQTKRNPGRFLRLPGHPISGISSCRARLGHRSGRTPGTQQRLFMYRIQKRDRSDHHPVPAAAADRPRTDDAGTFSGERRRRDRPGLRIRIPQLLRPPVQTHHRIYAKSIPENSGRH